MSSAEKYCPNDSRPLHARLLGNFFLFQGKTLKVRLRTSVQMNLCVAFIRPFVNFPLSLILTIVSYIIIAGKHSATMHEEHACKLHKAPTHHPRGLHIRWQRVLDTTGRAIGNCSQYRPQQSTTVHPGWDLLFCRIHNRLRRVRRAEGDPVLRELDLDQRSLLPGGGLEPGDVQAQLSRGI